MKKGYIRKVQNKLDKREFYLEVTEKYMEYNEITCDYIEVVMRRIHQRFSPAEVKQLEKMLMVISEELMPEITLTQKSREA